MPRPATKQPTDGELELLKLLWEAGPAELGRICAALRRKRPVATTTVATMLKVMLNKGLVERTRRPGGYLWSAKAAPEATRRGLLERLIDRVFEGSASMLVAHLIDVEGLSEAELNEIRALIEAKTSGPAEAGPPS
ncbi:MAG: BlaI/MecI/CopY family transcriptional regulator [Pirellulales bacterium]